MLQVISAACISLAIAIRRVPESAADLDDSARRGKDKVDSCNSFTVSTEDDLALRAGKIRHAHEPQESTLEVRFATRVQQQLAEKTGAGAAGAGGGGRANPAMVDDVPSVPASRGMNRRPVRNRPQAPRHQKLCMSRLGDFNVEPPERSGSEKGAATSQPRGTRPDLHREGEGRRRMTTLIWRDLQPKSVCLNLLPHPIGDSRLASAGGGQN